MNNFKVFLSKLQADKIKDFVESDSGIFEWIDFDRGNGKTTALQTLALMEAEKYPVSVLVPDYWSARHFCETFPREVFEDCEYKKLTHTLHYKYGIKVYPCNHYPEKTYGCYRECILFDDFNLIDQQIRERHLARARKAFLCATKH